jgi:uncharacterized protein (TIGR00297 family)
LLRCCEAYSAVKCTPAGPYCQYIPAGRAEGSQPQRRSASPAKDRSYPSRNIRGVDWGARLAIGFVFSGIIAVFAQRLKALTSSGAWAAVAVGTTLFAGGGWTWLMLVGTFFVTASILTRWDPRGEATPHRSMDAGGRRWDQVAANSGIAALAAVMHGLTGSPLAFGAAAGAVGAATADTWATELGRWSPAQPRLITNWNIVAPGTSGGITAVGTAGAAAGALLVSVTAAALAGNASVHPAFLAVLTGGLSGAIVDSILGATVEGRCRWINNSAVNLLATAWGAGVVLVIVR